MGVAIPQIITEDRASGALVVDGGLRFNTNFYLSRTPGSAGNRRTWTWSGWVKRSAVGTKQQIFGVTGTADADYCENYFGTDNKLYLRYGYTSVGEVVTTQVFRDISSWYHILFAFDATQSTASNKLKLYINGVEVTSFSTDTRSSLTNTDWAINRTGAHYLSTAPNGAGTEGLSALLSNVYLIDGQALDSSYFGYTDPLTNTWRPKKYVRTTTITGDTGSAVGFGTNGFYLPFDGSAPIGQDQSGRGNNWTPVNFGGSNTLEKATGALPILNTDGGGEVARVGVRTDSYSANLKLAVPFVGVATDVVQQINGNSASMTSFTANNATFAVHPTAGAPYGTGLYLNSVSDYPNINYAAGTFNFLHNKTGSGTVEFWMYNGAFNTEAIMLTSISGSPDVGFAMQMASSTTLQAAISRGVTGSARSSGTANIPQNTWSHIAVTKTINGSNAELKLYVNGVLSASNTSITASDLSNSNSTYSYFRIGQNIGDETARGWTNYYMNDLRIYDTVKYTQNFIPASTDPDILPDTPSGVAYSSNLTQITDGAVAFDGSGDWLTLSGSNDFVFGAPSGSSNDFTIEGFFYLSSFSASYYVLGGVWTTGSATEEWLIQIQNNGDMRFLTTVGTSFYGANISARRWYHFAAVRSSSTITLYVNGVSVGSYTNSNSIGSSSKTVYFGTQNGGTWDWNGFISNLHIVKGTALYTSNFTPPTAPISSVANTKLLCCKSNSSATAADVTPGTITANGNAVASNFNPFTVNINTQRGQESGYCTWNPLDQPANASVSNGNLTQTFTSYDRSARANMSVSSGKWFWEIQTSAVSGGECFGIQKDSASLTVFPGGTGGYGYFSGANVGTARFYDGGSYTSYGTTTVVGDVVNVALDLDSNQITFYKNGISQGTKTIVAGTYFPSVGHGSPGTTTFIANFGQKPFKFPPPAGFQPLALANTPRPTIVRPDQYVGIVTYTGNGTGSGQTKFVNTSFKADLIWIKDRDASNHHVLQDSVRGFSSTKLLSPNNTTAENTSNDPTDGAQRGYISESLYNGFTAVDGNNSTYSQINKNGTRYVAWHWKAGGNSNTFNINDIGYSTASAAGLTAGTITPTGASVNTKSGFSIIGYTGNGTGGATISHGLQNTPSFIIIKKRTSSPGATNWRVYHSALGNTKAIFLSTTGASDTSSTYWNNTSPTSSVFSLGTDDGLNASSQTHIAYLWAEIPGFSKFGSYTGNGSADGPVVITGFRPRWILLRETGNADYWFIFDTERSKTNPTAHTLWADQAQVENWTSINPDTTYNNMDILSNGFKLRSSYSATNRSSGTYIYAAFAETPTQNLYGAQSNAR